MSVFFVSESKPVSIADVFQRCRTTDEKHGVVDIVFLAEFADNNRARTFVFVN